MDTKTACDILGIDRQEKEWRQTLKKKYHEKALMYHPDKNKDPAAGDMFRRVHEAYQCLSEDTADTPQGFPSFEILLRYFTNSHTLDLMQQQSIHETMERVLLVCEHQAKQMVCKLEFDRFLKIYKLLIKYKHLFHLSADFYEFMEQRRIYWFAQGALKKRQKKDIACDDASDVIYDPDILAPDKVYQRCEDAEWNVEYFVEVEDVEDASNNHSCIMIIRPSLEDIITDNVYRCEYENETYLVPLWHHEVTYETLIVRIFPKLPSPNYWIDEDNNLHQRIEYTLYELWDYVTENRHMEVYFGKRRFIFYPDRLRLQMEQTWSWVGEGISEINQTNVYDVSRRADVVLHIHISGIM